MKMSRMRPLNVFPKLRRRLSSVQWILLLITTAMFFLSAASNTCTFSFGSGGGGPVIGGPPPQPSGGGLPGNVPGPSSVSPVPPAGGTTPSSASPVPPAGGTTPSSASPVPPAGGTTPSSAPTASGAPPGGGTTGGGGGAATGNTLEIDAVVAKDAKHTAGFAFSPETVTIKKGTKVTWVNKTSAPHNVTADKTTGPGSFPSSAATALAPGGPTSTTVGYSYTFATAGTYTYQCSLHPGQVGTITVT